MRRGAEVEICDRAYARRVDARGYRRPIWRQWEMLMDASKGSRPRIQPPSRIQRLLLRVWSNYAVQDIRVGRTSRRGCC